MNREEWLNYIEEDEKYPKRAIILDIYDDFESRICENCSYWDSNEQCELIEDDPYDIWAAIQNIVTEPTFGCNKFKRIINEI